MVDTLVEFEREEEPGIHGEPEELAKQLYDAGEGKWMGCDEQPFIDIFFPESFHLANALINLIFWVTHPGIKVYDDIMASLPSAPNRQHTKADGTSLICLTLLLSIVLVYVFLMDSPEAHP